jgi:hypothetical protein
MECGCKFDLIDLGYNPVTVSCEHGNAFHDHLSNFILVNYVVWIFITLRAPCMPHTRQVHT